MSLIAMQGGATGTGTVTLLAPITNTDRTLTLPDATDTVAGIAATQTLTNKSIAATQLTGTLAAARLPAGSVLQVVSLADPTQRSTTNTSFTASGMLVTITPTSATSKVFVQLDTCCYRNDNGSGYISIFRNGTNLAGSGNQLNMFNIGDKYVPLSISYLDSPASTSAVTYEVYYYRNAPAGNIYINSTNTGSTVGSITAMEIAA